MKRPSLGTSLLLSLPLSLGLPYILLGLTFRFTTCAGGMFCLPDVLDFLTCLGFLLFAFPFDIAYFEVSSFFHYALPASELSPSRWTVAPFAPLSGFTMGVNETFIVILLLAMVPQFLFWAVTIHLVRKMILPFIRIMLK